jgi:hypothetical protein
MNLESSSGGLTQLVSPQPPDVGGAGLTHPLLAGADDELSFQEDGFGVAPPQAGVAPPHPDDPEPLLLFAVAEAYGFGVRADEPQPGVLPPSCVYGFGVWELE